MNYTDLLKAGPEPGDAVALRAKPRDREYVVIGEVAAVNLTDTPEHWARVLEFTPDEYLRVEGDGLTPHPHRELLLDPPLAHPPYPEADPRPAPLSALLFREEGALGVSLPAAISDGSGIVERYDIQPAGTPLDFAHGEVVRPRDVLPSEISAGKGTEHGGRA